MHRCFVALCATWLCCHCGNDPSSDADLDAAAPDSDADLDEPPPDGDATEDAEAAETDQDGSSSGCEEIDCGEHGQCVETGGGPMCDCTPDYHQVDMTCVPDTPPPEPCDNITCSGHGSCTENEGAASCSCDDGYLPEGLRCVRAAGPSTYDITPMPAEFLSYPDLLELLRAWESEAPEIARYQCYGRVEDGQSHFAEEGTPYCALRIGTEGQAKLVLYAGIHGNEARGIAGTTWMIGQMLADFGRDPDVTWLVENRDVWWIPSLIPEMHLRRRDFDGVSTMGDFPDPDDPDHISTPPIAAFRRLFEEQRFVASISAHDTSLSGGYYWTNPIMLDSEGTDLALLMTIIEEMRVLAYGQEVIPDTYKALSDTGGNDIHWAYWHGALPLLVEFGNGTAEEPRTNPEDIEGHGRQHYTSYMRFIRRAPELQPGLTTVGQDALVPW